MTRSTERSKRMLVVVASLACVAATATAHAEPSASNVETARAAYVEGKTLRAAGDRAGALEKFKAAYLLAPTPITGLELGREFVFHAKLVEAREVLLTVDRMPQRADESAKAKAARSEAQTLAEKLRTSIPALAVHLVEPPAITSIDVDGESVPKEALASARRLNPGKHTVIVRGANNLEARATVDIVENEQRSISIGLGTAPEEPPAPAPAVVPQATADPAPASAPRTSEAPPKNGGFVAPSWLFPAGLAVGGTGLFVGAITGALAASEASVLRDRCTGGLCPRDVHDELRTVDTLGTVATIAFIAGGIGAVAAIVGVVFREKAPAAHALRRGTAWEF